MNLVQINKTKYLKEIKQWIKLKIRKSGVVRHANKGGHGARPPVRLIKRGNAPPPHKKVSPTSGGGGQKSLIGVHIVQNITNYLKI